MDKRKSENKEEKSEGKREQIVKTIDSRECAMCIIEKSKNTITRKGVKTMKKRANMYERKSENKEEKSKGKREQRVKTIDSGECVGKKPFSLPTSRHPQCLQLDC